MFEKYLYLADEMGEKYAKMFNVEVDDAQQEARVCLWETICRGNVRGRFETHFRRVCGKRLEKQLAVLGSCQIPDEVAVIVIPSEESFENQLFSSWDRVKVLEMLTDLCSDEEFDVIAMKHGLRGEAKSFSQIGEQLGRTVNQVAALYHMGLRRVRKASRQVGIRGW